MLCNDDDYKKKVMTNIYDVYNQDLLPKDHVNFLENVLYKNLIYNHKLFMILVHVHCIGFVMLVEFGKNLKYIVSTVLVR